MKIAGNLFLTGLFILALGAFVVNFLRENGSNDYLNFNFVVYIGAILMIISILIKLISLFNNKK